MYTLGKSISEKPTEKNVTVLSVDACFFLHFAFVCLFVSFVCSFVCLLVFADVGVEASHLAFCQNQAFFSPHQTAGKARKILRCTSADMLR